MKRVFLLVTSLAVALFFGMPAFAQHGGGHGGGPPSGGGPGMGGPGMGGSMGRGGTMGGTRGNGSMGGPNVGSQSVSHSSPTSVLSSNTHVSSTLQSRLGSMLPSGMSLTDSASGFKNLGQFVAAVHVSHNLGIPFDQLKTTMLSNGENMGKAIHTLNPNISTKDSKSEAKNAQKAANREIRDANKS